MSARRVREGQGGQGGQGAPPSCRRPRSPQSCRRGRTEGGALDREKYSRRANGGDRPPDPDPPSVFGKGGRGVLVGPEEEGGPRSSSSSESSPLGPVDEGSSVPSGSSSVGEDRRSGTSPLWSPRRSGSSLSPSSMKELHEGLHERGALGAPRGGGGRGAPCLPPRWKGFTKGFTKGFMNGELWEPPEEEGEEEELPELPVPLLDEGAS